MFQNHLDEDMEHGFFDSGPNGDMEDDDLDQAVMMPDFMNQAELEDLDDNENTGLRSDRAQDNILNDEELLGTLSKGVSQIKSGISNNKTFKE